jgi:26S proteasome regulatory subunit N2
MSTAAYAAPNNGLVAGGRGVMSSARSLVALLHEKDTLLVEAGLSQIIQVADVYWAELSEAVLRIEELYDDDSFPHKELAAMAASKLFYHLEQLDDALKYALASGELFDINNHSEFVDTLVNKCLDDYIGQRKAAFEALEGEEAALEGKTDAELGVNAQFSAVVEKVFAACMQERTYAHALGVAIESRRLDLVVVIMKAAQEGNVAAEPHNSPVALLRHCYTLSRDVVQHRGFRNKLLLCLVTLYKGLEVPDYQSMARCLLILEDTKSMTAMLNGLIIDDGSEMDHLVAIQIAFDLTEGQNVPFLLQVVAQLPSPEDELSDEERRQVTLVYAQTQSKEQIKAANKAEKAATAAATAASSSSSGDAADAASSSGDAKAMDTSSDAPAADAKVSVEDAADAAKAAQAAADALEDSENVTKADGVRDSYGARMMNIKAILDGTISTNLYLKFLYQHNKTDLNILKKIKDSLTQANAVLHNATAISHGIMHTGTTIDTFLNNNMEWLRNSFKNWSKFSAAASIGMIHKGHHKKAMELLGPYLPSPESKDEPEHGGALYALGLLQANHGADKVDFLLEELKHADGKEIRQHGACLGLGLAAMATGNTDYYEEHLQGLIFSESAVAGEAAAIANGLVMLGKCDAKSEMTEDLLNHARNSQQERIIRGIALGFALMAYGAEEGADALIEILSGDKDYVLRYGGMYAIAMAYAGTSNNNAVRKLLHFAVSDVKDDVRRAAVAALGFVLCNNPEKVPKVVSLLAESYNSNVRYGACLAVGVACAGTGMASACKLLLPLMRDRVDHVRQAALISLSMVCMQHNETATPAVAKLRKMFDEVLSRPRGDTMTKIGVIYGAGILDASGRNASLSLLSNDGLKKMEAVVGVMMFSQYWYWHAYAPFISLALYPTAVIGLNKRLQMPKLFNVVSHATPSTYAFPAKTELKKKEEKVEKKTATLSVSKKAKKAAGKKEAANATGMDIDSPAATAAPKEAKKAEEEDDAEKPEEKEEEKALEPEFEVLCNPSRVTPVQSRVVRVPEDSETRYAPIKETLSGFVVLRDLRPEEREQLVLPRAPGFSIPGISADEPEQPDPFELPARYR